MLRSYDCKIVLSDGSEYPGCRFGARTDRVCEIVFNTSMVGYQEIVSDPSYTGQLVVMTYPIIGNYGVTDEDFETKIPTIGGLVVREYNDIPSNFRYTKTLSEILEDYGIPAIEGVDTRKLTRSIRDHGSRKALLVDIGVPTAQAVARLNAEELRRDQVAQVSCKKRWYARTSNHRFSVVAVDCGIKLNIVRSLNARGCNVTVVPYDTPARVIEDMEPDGVFLSNGPGDPEAVTETYRQAEKLLGRVPLFGICLGHQMMAKAAGAEIDKLKFGHHGGNHPVQNLLTGRVEVTAQNHGFCPRFQSLGALVPELSGGTTEHVEDLREWGRRGIAPVAANERFGRIRLTHVNLDDGTAEGFAFLDVPAFSVQYHPEAAPGPTDAHYLFTAFARLMEGRDDYLDIDIASDRLSGWKFGSTVEGEVA